jgi:hypothetical protein
VGPALALMYSPTVELHDCQYLQQKHFSQPSLGRVEQSMGDHLSIQGRPGGFHCFFLMSKQNLNPSYYWCRPGGLHCFWCRNKTGTPRIGQSETGTSNQIIFYYTLDTLVGTRDVRTQSARAQPKLCKNAGPHSRVLCVFFIQY